MTPNPGSDEAGEMGCICAVMDNNHGKYPPWPPDGWWVTQGCPLHAAPQAGEGQLALFPLEDSSDLPDAA